MNNLTTKTQRHNGRGYGFQATGYSGTGNLRDLRNQRIHTITREAKQNGDATSFRAAVQYECVAILPISRMLAIAGDSSIIVTMDVI